MGFFGGNTLCSEELTVFIVGILFSIQTSELDQGEDDDDDESREKSLEPRVHGTLHVAVGLLSLRSKVFGHSSIVTRGGDESQDREEADNNADHGEHQSTQEGVTDGDTHEAPDVKFTSGDRERLALKDSLANASSVEEGCEESTEDSGKQQFKNNRSINVVNTCTVDNDKVFTLPQTNTIGTEEGQSSNTIIDPKC